MFQTTLSSFDLDQIAASGQCFTWQRQGDRRWVIPAYGRCLIAEQQGGRFSFSCDADEWNAVWHPYFDLDSDYDGLKARIDPADAYLTAAAAYGGGIRILRQDLWEVLVSFLISQNNNIVRISRSIQGLCARYGERRDAGGTFYFTFPSPDALAGAGDAAFLALGLGYRAKYLAALVRRMQDGGLAALETALAQADDREARCLLTGIYGIGPKVADCVCLFGLHRMDAFPADTHIRKILCAHYPEGFPAERYAGMLGAVQQYLFYYDLKQHRAISG